MFASMLRLDVKTLMEVLFLGNLVSVALILAYTWCGSAGTRVGKHYLPAKLFQAMSYFLLMSRGTMPDFYSVNLGNTLLLFGFYLESLAMLVIIQEFGTLGKCLTGMLIACVVAFNIIEFARPDSSIRVAVSSVCVFSIMVVPNLLLIFSRNTTSFKRWAGIFYLGFLVFLLPRAYYAATTEMGILTNSLIQTLTFLSLVMLLIFSLPAYLLLMKEDSDKVIQEMATTDYLTGLSNRYSFLEAAERAFRRHRVDGKYVSVIFFDIDYFKSINDTYGHAFGDTVLVALGKVVRESLRPTDLSCRYGGEEFVIFLPDATMLTAVKVSERIRMEMKNLRFKEQPDFHFTVSVGVTDGIPGKDDSLDLYISQADAALYTAKKSGRDQIVEYDPVSNFISDI